MQSVAQLVFLAAAAQAGMPSSTRPFRQTGDAGQPLFLTPFIEAGDVMGGQAEAAVESLAGSVRSFAGFLTVNKALCSNMFFWFFPAERQPDTAPVLLWLQGGPGATSMFGLFSENGPYVAQGGKVTLRKYSWRKRYNLLYIDNPVNTGYSFTRREEGYARNQTQVGRDLYSAVLQFFQLFPKLQGREFFVTGESYAGKYVPALAYTIHKNNPAASLKINLQGLFIGNGFCDPENMITAYSGFLFQLGLLDSHGRDAFKEYENRILRYIRQERWEDAYWEQDNLLGGDYNKHPTLFKNLTGFDFYYNFLYTKGYDRSEGIEIIQLSENRRRLHVGDSEWHMGPEVEERLREDVLKSVAPWVAELLNHYRVMMYNGQLDIGVAYALSDSFLSRLRWSGAAEFKKARRKIWMVGDEVAGYAKSAGRLTQVLVRDAGHMVPSDQPRWALDLLNKFVRNEPL